MRSWPPRKRRHSKRCPTATGGVSPDFSPRVRPRTTHGWLPRLSSWLKASNPGAGSTQRSFAGCDRRCRPLRSCSDLLHGGRRHAVSNPQRGDRGGQHHATRAQSDGSAKERGPIPGGIETGYRLGRLIAGFRAMREDLPYRCPLRAVARSLTSGGYLRFLDMTLSSQGIWSPSKPGRFRHTRVGLVTKSHGAHWLNAWASPRIVFATPRICPAKPVTCPISLTIWLVELRKYALPLLTNSLPTAVAVLFASTGTGKF